MFLVACAFALHALMAETAHTHSAINLTAFKILQLPSDFVNISVARGCNALATIPKTHMDIIWPRTSTISG